MAFERNIVKVITLALLLLSGTQVSAQVVYSCDFENASENALWTLNKVSNNRPIRYYRNVWGIGPNGNSAQGTAGLYIYPRVDSVAMPNLAVASDSASFIVAYRDLIAVTAPGTVHRISFDWRGNGKSGDGLYVYWIPDTYGSNTNSAIPTGSIPAALNNYCILAKNASGQPTGLRGAPTWRTYSATFTPTTSNGKLLFLWYQNSGVSVNPPAAVDNIEITLNTPCAMPSNVKYNRATNTLTWTGNAVSYQIRACNTHTDEWVVDSTTNKTYTFGDLGEGTVLFQVRSDCGGAHSDWVSITQFISSPGKRCIDYFDYGDQPTSKGICYVGSHSSSTSHATLSFSPSPMVIDYGPENPASMHTLHTQIGEVDPNTTVNGGLRTIPDGEIASIRLGAYTSSGQDARIEYKYTIKDKNPFLLDLSYACVLESGGHQDDNPFFQLDILDQQGHQIDGCTHAYFVADMSSSGSGWHQEGSIYWCDWRTVTVSLTNFPVGQSLTIRLTSSRCVYDTHFGYAYFTLNCRNGSLQGISCGDFSTDHFTAPDGFDYRWYKGTDNARSNILSTDQTYNIGNKDTTIYKVDVISKLDGNCYYTLVADPNPRYPEAKADQSVSQKACQNVVRLLNKSGVVTVNRETYAKTHSEEDVEAVYVDFDDQTPMQRFTEPLIEHTFPQSGGHFDVKVIASMSGGICQDTLHIPLDLPELGDKRTETIIDYCYDGVTPYTYKGVRHNASFQDSITTTLGVGCDSTDVLTVNFVERVTSELHDTICGEVNNYTYNGVVYDKTGDYPVHFWSAAGCDSIVTLHLYKHPLPTISVDSSLTACADEGNGIIIPYSLLDVDATVDSIYVEMGDEAVANGFSASYGFSVGDLLHITWPADISPNVYQGKVVFSSPWCKSYAFDFKVELYYPSSTLDQKNGIVAVLNEGANGGYNFLSYQWYRNGERLDGETASYIRVSDEEDLNAEYYVMVLRADDNVVLRSCPIVYTGGGRRDALEDVRGESTAVKVMKNGILYIIRDGICYTVLGTVISHEQ